jgi:hypothetical protein
MNKKWQKGYEEHTPKGMLSQDIRGTAQILPT